MADHFLIRAAQELGIEKKVLLADTRQFLEKLDWPGNVRQLENFCRWVTVMASGRDIHIDDLPPELKQSDTVPNLSMQWEDMLEKWVENALHNGSSEILNDVVPRFEKIMIEAALKKTGGRRQDAARLLGWGRNTLTRKIKELGL